MSLPSGWVRIRNWIVPWGDPVIRDYLRRGPHYGATPADKQPPVLLTELALPIPLMDERPASATDALEQPNVTRIDSLMRFGLKDYEVAWFLEDVGTMDRVLEVLDWVVSAHRWQENAELPLDRRDLGVASYQDAHPKAVRTVIRLLEQVRQLDNASVPEIRAIFHRRIPGVPFPQARSVDDMEKVIVVALNMTMWFAHYGTHLCGCPAMAWSSL